MLGRRRMPIGLSAEQKASRLRASIASPKTDVGLNLWLKKMSIVLSESCKSRSPIRISAQVKWATHRRMVSTASLALALSPGDDERLRKSPRSDFKA